MSAKKYVVAVVGIIKKNGEMANAGDEVTADNFNNFEEHVLKGGYVKEKADYEKDEKEADVKALEAVDQKKLEKLFIAYKKEFKVDAPANATAEALKKAMHDNKAILSDKDESLDDKKDETLNDKKDGVKDTSADTNGVKKLI